MSELILKQYTADAFADEIFRGNPAAVCVLDSWISDSLMQDIAVENNLSETAFCVKNEDNYELRWFTPGGEIDLCGHATLACAFVLLNFYEAALDEIVFSTKSGNLTVADKKRLYEMTFPTFDLKAVPVSDEMAEALGQKPEEAYLGRDLLCIFDDADIIAELNPDMDRTKELDGLLVHATAHSENGGYDCISRSFAPRINIEEDPVCGSGHCHIVPYWSEKLNKNKITAFQASKREGMLYCEMLDRNHMKIAGPVRLYSISELHIPKKRFDE